MSEAFKRLKRDDAIAYHIRLCEVGTVGKIALPN